MTLTKVFVAAIAIIAAGSAGAANTVVCAGNPAAINGTPIGSDPNMFIQNGFTPKCSANVFMNFDQNNLAAAVASASRKGRTIFAGHTNGGSPASAGACASTTTGCAATDLATPLQTALTASASS